MHIIIFIGFLVIYAAFIWAGSTLSNRITRDILANKTFWVTQLSNLVSLGALFAFISVLTGYFNARLIAALFGASQIGVILTLILGGFLGSSASKWGARAQWAGGEYGLKHGPATLGVMALTTLIFVAYPVAVGISYFGLPAADLPARIFQYTLCLIFLGGYPLMLLVLIGTLVSENLDEETRTRFLAAQLASLVPNALWLALVFWSFGISGAGQQLNIGSVSIELSPLLIAVLIGFFVLTVFIPFLVGTQRAKRWRTFLLEKRQEWLEKFEDILKAPTTSSYLPKLSTLQDSLHQEMTRFAANDPMIAYGVQIDQGATPPELANIAPAYQLARDLDPRFKHLDSLLRLYEKIGEIRAELSKLTTDADLKKAAKDWADYLHPQKEDLSKELVGIKTARTPTALIWIGIIVPIGNVLLSDVAKWLWGVFAQA